MVCKKYLLFIPACLSEAKFFISQPDVRKSSVWKGEKVVGWFETGIKPLWADIVVKSMIIF